MSSLLPLLIFLLPGLLGTLIWLLPRHLKTARWLSMGGALLWLALDCWLLWQTAQGSILVHVFGNWSPPYGIVFVADRLAALFLCLLAILALLAFWILSTADRGRETTARILPLLWMVCFGLSGAFLTGDLFNLFVMFEVVLLSSYLLIQVPGGERSLKAAFPNIAINLIGSILFFTGVGVLYAEAGTVNLADLSLRLDSSSSALALAGTCMLIVAFSIKSGLVPFLFWLPATYPVLSGPVAALFAGMMTKLGVYALMRIVPLLMQESPVSEALIWLGGVSALLGVLAALSQLELRRLLGFHIVSQVGYMVLGLGLMTATAISAAIFYLIHHVLVKAALFFIADTLEKRSGSRNLEMMKGVGAGNSWLAALFAISAFSLAGLPPFSGFFAKIGLFRATIQPGAWGWLAVLVIASAYTLISMLKIWSYVFVPASSAARERDSQPSLRFAPLLVLVGISLLMAAAAGPVSRFASDTAEQLLDTETYTRVVLSAAGRGHLQSGDPR